MELIYPFVLLVGIPLVIFLIVFKFKKANDYKQGKKVANTKYIKNDPYYMEVVKKYKILAYSIKIICMISIIICIFLISRPAILGVNDSSNYNRDIFLCMDVSASVDELNLALVEDLKETVKSLKGERFGISIFNTSSVLLVPLTDDYEYVINVLDNLAKAFRYSQSSDFSDEAMYLRQYIQAGTLVGNEQRGSSLIGDGLATCITNFGNLEEDRTRIIIFSTDNDLQGTEIIPLSEAAQMCSQNNITVFGIGPDFIKNTTKDNELKQAIELTGGSCYIQSDSTTVPEIVENIEQKGKSLIKGKSEIRKIDVPQVPFIVLTICIVVLFILNKKVNV